MTALTVAQLVQSASQLPVDQLMTLNKALCQLIRSNRRAEATVVGSQFKIGDVVRFDAKRKGIKHIVVEKFNRAGTSVVGHECYPNGQLISMGVRWTVTNTLCTKVA